MDVKLVKPYSDTDPSPRTEEDIASEDTAVAQAVKNELNCEAG